MDSNYLLRRRDEELQWAKLASCEEARQAHTALAACFNDAAEKSSRQRPISRNMQMPAAADRKQL